MKFKMKQENTQFILLVIVLHVIFYYCYKKKIKPQGLILLFGGGETGKQRIIARRKMDKWGRSRKVKERDIEGEI